MRFDQAVLFEGVEEFRHVAYGHVHADSKFTAELGRDLLGGVLVSKKFEDLRSDYVEREHPPVFDIQNDATVGRICFAHVFGDSKHDGLHLIRRNGREGANLPRKLRECQNYEFLSGIQTWMESNTET